MIVREDDLLMTAKEGFSFLHLHFALKLNKIINTLIYKWYYIAWVTVFKYNYLTLLFETYSSQMFKFGMLSMLLWYWRVHAS